MKKVAILQSNYIPWKGYFDLIAYVDEFIIYDDMQYTRRDWRNRNKVKTPQGLRWLTVPVAAKGRYDQTVRKMMIAGDRWADQHWKSLTANYARAPRFKEIAPLIEPLYLRTYASLSELNRAFIGRICEILGIRTHISNSADYELIEGRTERLAHLCRQAGGAVYVSGPSARNYVDPVVFDAVNIELEWFGYENYPHYHQLWGEFVHQVTILDLLFNCGHDAPSFMKHVKRSIGT